MSYRILYLFFVFREHRRGVAALPYHGQPDRAWIWQVVEATPLCRQPKFLIHDRDADYGRDFHRRLAKLDITGGTDARGASGEHDR